MDTRLGLLIYLYIPHVLVRLEPTRNSVKPLAATSSEYPNESTWLPLHPTSRHPLVTPRSDRNPPTIYSTHQENPLISFPCQSGIIKNSRNTIAKR